MARRVRKKKYISLKWGLVALICTCWVVPIFVILLVFSSMLTSNLERQITDMMTNSANNEIQMTQNRIAAIIDASKRPSYDPQVRSGYERYRKTGDEVALFEVIDSFLIREYRYDEHFEATFFYLIDEPERIYHGLGREHAGVIDKSRKYLEHVHPQVQALSMQMGTEIRFMQTEEGIFMVRNIMDSRYKPYAVIVHALNLDGILQGLNNVLFVESVSVGFDDVAAKLSQLPAASFYDAAFSRYDRDTQRFYFNTYRRIEGHVIWYSIVANGGLLLQELPDYDMIAVMILLLSIPFLALVVLMFYRHVSKPVNLLVDAASRVEAGEMGYTLASMPANEEFYSLTAHFNSMSVRLKAQFERIYMEQQALQSSRIKALQSQINPHFLNNTLEVINWEARMAGDKKVSQMIEALSTMLNAAMARDERPVISLSDELNYVEAYLYITSVRFGKRLRVEWNVDDTLLEQLVPRLIMQPVVENAVEHGVAKHGQGALHVRIFRDGARLIIEVENDSPLSEKDKRAIKTLLETDGSSPMPSADSSIGIRNVHLRLQMMYGPEYGLRVIQSPLGTLAQLLLPYDAGMGQTP